MYVSIDGHYGSISRYQPPNINFVVHVFDNYHLTATTHVSLFFFFSSRRRHTRFDCDWSSDVCSSDLPRATAWPFSSISSTGSPAVKSPSTRRTPAGNSDVRRSTTARTAPSSSTRSEERRVGEEGRSRGGPVHLKKKKKERTNEIVL